MTENGGTPDRPRRRAFAWVCGAGVRECFVSSIFFLILLPLDLQTDLQSFPFSAFPHVFCPLHPFSFNASIGSTRCVYGGGKSPCLNKTVLN